MFEESLVVSQVTSVSATKRWTMVGSTALQIAIAATLVVIPMLHPERLTLHLQTPLVFTPPPQRTPLPVTEINSARSETAAMPSVTIAIRSQIPSFTHHTPSDSDAPPSITAISNGWNTGTSTIGDVLSSTNHGIAVSVASAKPAPKLLKVSGGVIAGMLMEPIQPLYPAIARAAHVSGSIVVEAIISKAGTIESLHVISGPQMLRGAALDAIRVARYKPFLLNGEPTEVRTTITVNFTMGG